MTVYKVWHLGYVTSDVMRVVFTIEGEKLVVIRIDAEAQIIRIELVAIHIGGGQRERPHKMSVCHFVVLSFCHFCAQELSSLMY